MVVDGCGFMLVLVWLCGVRQVLRETRWVEHEGKPVHATALCRPEYCATGGEMGFANKKCRRRHRVQDRLSSYHRFGHETQAKNGVCWSRRFAGSEPRSICDHQGAFVGTRLPAWVRACVCRRRWCCGRALRSLSSLCCVSQPHVWPLRVAVLLFFLQAIERVAEKFVDALRASLTVGDDLDKQEFQAMLEALGAPQN